MIVVEGVETVDCEGLNTVIPGKTKLPLSHQVHIMGAIIIIVIIFCVCHTHCFVTCVTYLRCLMLNK